MLQEIGTGRELWEARAVVPLGLGMWLPARMTVVRLSDGGLLLYSPIAIDGSLAAELAALGPVRHLVAPNLFHHLFLAEAALRYPQARVYAPSTLAKKRAALPPYSTLGGGAPAEWLGELDPLTPGGAPGLSETVLLHRPTGTLLCADLVFNIRQWQGMATGALLWCCGTRGQLAFSRLARLAVRDRVRFRTDTAAVAAWPLRRIVMAHGDIYESPSVAADLAGAFTRRLGAADPRPG